MNHDEFVHKIANDRQQPAINGKPVLVALSGGADSVALLRVLLELGHDCRAAHCNFHLRGAESARDEQFVRQLCQQLDVPLIVKDFDVAAWQAEHGGSVEMACRQLRYQWFGQESEKQGCCCIAVAHHADDQVETFFLNLLRGTGLRGLTGMERLNHKIWRPLLTVNRANILDYLSSIGQEYVTDSTNAMNEYRRNRLRNIILPAIEQEFPGSTARILDTMSNLSQDHELLTSLVDSAMPDIRNIEIGQLCSHPQAATLLYHRIRHLGFNRDQCDQAVEAARQGHSGRQFLTSDYSLVVNRKTLVIEHLTASKDKEIPFDPAIGIESPIHITVHHSSTPFSPRMCSSTRVAFSTRILDCKHIVLRHWRRGDRFQPFGMRGSKLVSDLFNDLKLDHLEKQNAWLLEADGNIVWVVGYRSSAHYPVAIESQDYLMMTVITP